MDANKLSRGKREREQLESFIKEIETAFDSVSSCNFRFTDAYLSVERYLAFLSKNENALKAQ